MTFYLINENGASVVNIDNTNKAINDLLGWDDYWDCPTIYLDGNPYIAVCSDTGKIRHEPVSAISHSNLIAPNETIREPFLVGAIIITKFDGIDDFASLNAEDIETIERHLFETGLNRPKDLFKTILILD